MDSHAFYSCLGMLYAISWVSPKCTCSNYTGSEITWSPGCCIAVACGQHLLLCALAVSRKSILHGNRRVHFAHGRGGGDLTCIQRTGDMKARYCRPVSASILFNFLWSTNWSSERGTIVLTPHPASKGDLFWQIGNVAIRCGQTIPWQSGQIHLISFVLPSSLESFQVVYVVIPYLASTYLCIYNGVSLTGWSILSVLCFRKTLSLHSVGHVQ